MWPRRVSTVALLVALVALVASATAAAKPPVGDCQNDTKLIGPIQLSTEYRDGTWWQLTRDGLIAAGITTDVEQRAFIEAVFGRTFTSLGEAVGVLVDAVRPLDRNGNDVVCASRSTGTKAVIGDPSFAYYYFGVIDDKHVPR